MITARNLIRTWSLNGRGLTSPSLSYNAVVKKLLLLASLCTVLGAVVTIGVAWYCTTSLDWNHWTPVARGPTDFEAPFWLVDSYEAPGFQLAHAWPIFDSDGFFGKSKNSVYGDGRFRRNGPLALEPWMVTFANAPNSQNDALAILTIDLRGWPRPALLRTVRTDLRDEARYDLKLRIFYSWQMSEYDQVRARGSVRKDLVRSTPLPLKPYWPGFLFDTALYTGAWAFLFILTALFRPMTRNWGFRHRCALVLMCFGSGLLATVGVAWGCSTWIDVGNGSKRNLGSGLDGSGVGPTGRELWDVQLNTRPGLTRLASRYLTSWVGSHISSPRPAESLMPWWADDAIQLNDQGHDLALYGCGWPTHALWWWEESISPINPTAIPHGGIELAPWPISTNARWQGNGRALPLQPIWLGLIVDTPFYGTCAFGFFALCRGGVLTHRRWRLKQKGLCPNCKYALRELASERCPECGHLLDRTQFPQTAF